ncbi:hypothetical protein Pelo_17749 [Pelomyxa schiedti]|nr:hypothetical protein Pelo_17749 [Pelomyxa schiedti]
MWHDSNSVDVRDGEWVYNATANYHEMQGWGATVKMVVMVYEGEWDRHQWHGVGMWRSPDGSGDIYHGQFDHGKKCGTGSILFGAGGGSYVGEWKDDVFHGRGVRLWANSDRYDGQWVGGKENGEGTKTWCRDGSSFTGLWEGGVPTKGMRRWPNGDMFEGTFTQVPQGGGGSNCEFHGEGALTLSKRPSGGVGMLKESNIKWDHHFHNLNTMNRSRVSTKKKKSHHNALDSATPPGKAVMETGARADDTAPSNHTPRGATSYGGPPTTHKEGDRTVKVTTRDAADSSLMQQFNEAAEGDDDVAEDDERTEEVEVERVHNTRCVEDLASTKCVEPWQLKAVDPVLMRPEHLLIWLEDFHNLTRNQRLTTEWTNQLFRSLIKGVAAPWAHEIPNDAYPPSVLESCRNHFIGEAGMERLRRDVAETRQSPSESVSTYIRKMVQRWHCAGPCWECKMDRKMVVPPNTQTGSKPGAPTRNKLAREVGLLGPPLEYKPTCEAGLLGPPHNQNIYSHGEILGHYVTPGTVVLAVVNPTLATVSHQSSICRCILDTINPTHMSTGRVLKWIAEFENNIRSRQLLVVSDAAGCVRTRPTLHLCTNATPRKPPEET